MKTKKLSIREKLIDVIIETSGDELENVEDYLELAKESEEELIDRLINILHYYRESVNN